MTFLFCIFTSLIDTNMIYIILASMYCQEFNQLLLSHKNVPTSVSGTNITIIRIHVLELNIRYCMKRAGELREWKDEGYKMFYEQNALFIELSSLYTHISWYVSLR